MSNWTLEKIRECKEIKFGTYFNTDQCIENNEPNDIITRVEDDGSFSWISRDFGPDGYDLEEVKKYARTFHFYHPDGTEILPPEDEKPKKLYAYKLRSVGENIIVFNGAIIHFDVPDAPYMNSRIEFERHPEWDIVKSEGV